MENLPEPKETRQKKPRITHREILYFEHISEVRPGLALAGRWMSQEYQASGQFLKGAGAGNGYIRLDRLANFVSVFKVDKPLP